MAKKICLLLSLIFSCALNAFPLIPAALAGAGLRSAVNGGFLCDFNYGGDGCKGNQKLKQEEARQQQIITDNLLRMDRMNQADTTFNIAATATVNGNQIQNMNTLNEFRLGANNLLTSSSIEFGKKLGSDLNENIQVNHALQSKLLNGGSNNAKSLVDFGAFVSAKPKQLGQEEYDRIFSS